MIKAIEYLLPFLTGTIDDFLAKKRAEFHRSSTGDHATPSVGQHS
jgi:hypothetical protein